MVGRMRDQIEAQNTPDLLTPAQIEDRAARVGLTMTEVCRRAGVVRQTWQRWRAGKSQIGLVSYYKLTRVLDAAEKGEAA